MEPRILFVSNRNILTTCGELRLIKNRAETLYTVYGITTDFIALSNSKRIDSEQKEKIEAGGSVYIIRQDANIPGTIIQARKELKNELSNRLDSGRYCAVIFSGSGMPIYSKYVKSIDPTVKVLADVHGASEDIVELVKEAPMKRRLFNRIIYMLDKHGLKASISYVDGYFVVTEALREYVKINFKTKSNAKYYIAPCATNNVDNDYFEKYYNYRMTYRAKYGLDDSTKVFIYSGGVSSWQCIEETISIYREIKKVITNSKLLVFSHNIEAINRIANNDQDIIVDSYRPNELTKALCSGDFAFMLRTDCVTNNVAFPNKYLEYVQSRMKIISTPYVYEIARQIKENNIGYLYEMNNNLNGLLKYIKESSINSDDVVKKIMKSNSFEVTLKEFSESLRHG